MPTLIYTLINSNALLPSCRGGCALGFVLMFVLLKYGCYIFLMYKLFNFQTAGYSLRNFTGHSTSVMSLDFHPTKQDIICSNDSNGEIRIWSVNKGSCPKVMEVKSYGHLYFCGPSSMVLSVLLFLSNCFTSPGWHCSGQISASYREVSCCCVRGCCKDI